MARMVAVAVLVAALLAPMAGWAQPAEGLPPIMPLAEVRPGMRGVGRTVIKGQQIEEFGFEVLGVLRDVSFFSVRHLILFRMTGPMVDRTGGIAAGMSGSPMLVNGRLIGALSASYIFQPDRRDLGLATPIEEMLRVLNIESSAPSGRISPAVFVSDRPLRIDGRRLHRVVVAPTPADARRIAAARLPGTAVAVPASFPVSLSGASPRARQLVQRVLGLREPLQGYAAGPASFPAAPITGGSSVGVMQARGDINFGGICTVTLRVGNRLLICGHPWDLLGEVEYVLTTSDIITVVRTLQRPFKEANLGEMVGKIDQDRGAAIRGVLGQVPHLFAVRVTVTDLDSGKTIAKGMQVVRRADLARLFATVMALTAVDQIRDQVLGGGTARVKISLRGRGLPRVIVRENLVFHTRDIGLASLADLPRALNFLFFNDLTKVDASDVSVEIGFSTKRTTAVITDAQVERREVSPGDTLRVRLTMRPFQEAAVLSRVIDVSVPRNYPRGPAVLVIRSAGEEEIPAEVPPGERIAQALIGEPPPIQADTLEEAIERFEEFGKNTDILIQLIPFGLPTDGGEFVKFDVFAGRLVRTDWFIQGVVQIPINVR